MAHEAADEVGGVAVRSRDPWYAPIGLKLLDGRGRDVCYNPVPRSS